MSMADATEPRMVWFAGEQCEQESVARDLLGHDSVQYRENATGSSVEGVLARLVERASARLALLVSRHGDFLGMAGRSDGVEPRSVAALAAATHAATRELADKVNEHCFEVVLLQGRERHVHASIVGNDHILVVVFEGIHNVGKVRFASAGVQSELLDAMGRDREAARKDLEGFRERASRLLDDAFSGYLKG